MDYELQNILNTNIKLSEQLEIQMNEQQKQTNQDFHKKIIRLINGLRVEADNLSLLMGAPKMRSILFQKSQEFNEWLNSLIQNGR